MRLFAEQEAPSPEGRARVAARLRTYAELYPAYEEVALLGMDGRVFASLSGESGADPALAREALQAAGGFCERYGPTPLRPGQAAAHVLARRLNRRDSAQPAGVLCLFVRRETEFGPLFTRLCASYDGSALLVLGGDGAVLASSDENLAPAGARMEPEEEGETRIAFYRGAEYLCRSAFVVGGAEQGLSARVMLPLALAFREAAGAENARELPLTESFSDRLGGIMEKIADIGRLLKRIVFNGQALAVEGGREAQSLSPVLRSIDGIGGRIAKTFGDSARDLSATVAAVSLSDARFRAALCADMLARNFRERSGDCRWWALTATFRHVLAQPAVSEKDRRTLSEALAFLGGLSPLFTCVFLFDASGAIAAASGSAAALSGSAAQSPAVEAIRKGRAGLSCAVSAFEPNVFSAGRPAWLFAAPVPDPAGNRTAGGVGLVLGGEALLGSILSGALQGRPGAFAVFADQTGKILASTEPSLRPGDALALEDEAPLRLAAGETYSGAMPCGENICAVGCARLPAENAGGTLAFVFEPLAPRARRRAESAGAPMLAQRDIPHRKGAETTGLAVFAVGGRLMAVDTRAVVETAAPQAAAALPASYETVKGVIAYRNKYTVVVDMRRMFRLPEAEPKHLLIVRATDEAYFALTVDDLCGVFEVDRRFIRSVPIAGGGGSILKGVVSFEAGVERVILLLDEEALKEHLHPEPLPPLHAEPAWPSAPEIER